MFEPLGAKTARRVDPGRAPNDPYRPGFLVSMVCLNSIMEGGIAAIIGWLLVSTCTDGMCPGLQPFGVAVAIGGALLVALAGAILFRAMARKHLPYLAVGNILFGGFWVGLLSVDYLTAQRSLDVVGTLHFVVADVLAPMVLALTCVWVIISSSRAAKEIIPK